ncbi:TRAP transporter large permease [Rhodococcus sp. 5G237]
MTSTLDPVDIDTAPPKPPKKIASALNWFGLVFGMAAVGIAGVMLFADLDRLTVGILTIILLVNIMFIGIPVGVAMILAAVVGLFSLRGHRMATSSLQELVFDGVASWSLSVIPLFALMGVAMWRSGMTAKAFASMYLWFGRLPGGPAIATNAAGAGLAATSGSTIGISFALGRMAIPEMLKIGYSPKIATATVAMAGTLGQVIPPSILLIIYAGVAQVPVGPQLVAGIVPGVLLALAFSVTIFVWAMVRPSMAPRASMEGVTLGDRLRSLGGLIPLVTVAVVVLGGIISGIFTATESAAVGALVALLFGWLSLGSGKRGVRSLASFVKDSAVDAVASVASLFLVLIGALLIGRIITLSGLAQALTSYLVGLDLGRVQLLLILVVVYIVLGMFLESTPMILLTVPLLQAPLEAVGIDMLWFGVFIIIMCEIGMVFPPIGMLVFVIHRLAQDPKVNLGRRITLVDVYKGIMPFVLAVLGVVLLIILWPDLVVWLPGLSASTE